jgi:hypothetical protein
MPDELELELELDELKPPRPGNIPPPHAVSAELTAPKTVKRIASVLMLLNLVTDIAIDSQEDIVVVYEPMSTATASGRSENLVHLLDQWQGSVL